MQDPNPQDVPSCSVVFFPSLLLCTLPLCPVRVPQLPSLPVIPFAWMFRVTMTSDGVRPRSILATPLSLPLHSPSLLALHSLPCWPEKKDSCCVRVERGATITAVLLLGKKAEIAGWRAN